MGSDIAMESRQWAERRRRNVDKRIDAALANIEVCLVAQRPVVVLGMLACAKESLLEAKNLDAFGDVMRKG